MQACSPARGNTLEIDKDERRLYADIPVVRWSQDDVLRLREADVYGLYDNLNSVMQDLGDQDGQWKAVLGKDLILREQDSSMKSRIWGSLCVLARENRWVDFSELAEIAWAFVDSCQELAPSNLELSSVLDFLGDVRVFAFNRDAYNRIADKTILEIRVKTQRRFDVFTCLRCISTYGSISTAGRLALELSGSSDFVIRESAFYAIGDIYTRQDCDSESLGDLIGRFERVLEGCCLDPHWYVRKAVESSLYFHNLHRTESGEH